MTLARRIRTAVPAGWPGVALVALGLVLAGAAAFGLWHLVVGGFINGNPRAGTFGLVLALAAGLPLVAGAWVMGRRRRAP
jgi:hypothetical protein